MGGRGCSKTLTQVSSRLAGRTRWPQWSSLGRSLRAHRTQDTHHWGLPVC